MNRISSAADAEQRIVAFIRQFTAAAGFSRIVIGLSGGIDSSVSAALGVRALGPENVLALVMPYKSSSAASQSDAEAVAGVLGIATETIDISPMVDAYFGDTDISAVRRGNKMARERMSLLFDIAARDNRLVLGTSNKTEICLGYSTWYGDSACSLNPLGGLYKREIREMAANFGIPGSIIDKPPSADLWPGQTDEGELGITYDIADTVLFALIEQGERSLARLTSEGIDEKIILAIIDRINRFEYKRALPATDLLGGRPVPAQITLADG